MDAAESKKFKNFGVIRGGGGQASGRLQGLIHPPQVKQCPGAPERVLAWLERHGRDDTTPSGRPGKTRSAIQFANFHAF
jgi:hypothetical protein